MPSRTSADSCGDMDRDVHMHVYNVEDDSGDEEGSYHHRDKRQRTNGAAEPEDYAGFVAVYDLENDTEVLEERPCSLSTLVSNKNASSEGKHEYLNPAISEVEAYNDLGRCPICLEKLDNPSIPDTCTHQFCFICIVHWSSTAPACPICKRGFNFIVHNIVSASEYKRYYPKENNAKNGRSRTHAPPSHNRTSSSTSSSRRDPHPPPPALAAPPPHLFLTEHEHRRAVYARQLSAKPSASSTPSASSSSSSHAPPPPYLTPDLLSSRPALLARLKPWLTRDLQAILQLEDVHLLVELILSLLRRYDTRTHTHILTDHLAEYIPREYAHAFVHEMVCYAVSKHPSMSAYDKHVQYETRTHT